MHKIEYLYVYLSTYTYTHIYPDFILTQLPYMYCKEDVLVRILLEERTLWTKKILRQIGWHF